MAERVYVLVWDTVTGRIERTVSTTTEEAALQAQAGEAILTQADAPDPDVEATFYVQPDPPTLVLRPTGPMSINKTVIKVGGVPPNGVATISNIPVDTVLAVRITTPTSTSTLPDQTITDGTVAYTTDIVGTHRLTLTRWPYRDMAYTLTATLP